MKPSGIITLLSDFGLADGYVAAMKGVILAAHPRITVVDVSHLVEPQDVGAGAFVLATVVPHFPLGSVHLAVVDPGVGSARLPVAVEGERFWLVGPDNGLLCRAIGDDARRVVRIDEVPGNDRPRSSTFHGRDLFAPAAAHLAGGGSIGDLGPEVEGLEPLVAAVVDKEGSKVSGVVVHIDHFGNAVTNLRPADLPGRPEEATFLVAGHRIGPLVGCYADARVGEVCVLADSEGFVEVALRDGAAASALGLTRGDPIVCFAAEEGSSALEPADLDE